MRWFILCLLPNLAFADAVITTRVIRAGEIVTAADLSLVPADIPHALTSIEEVAGQQARQILYPGRAIRLHQLGPSTIVQRNQVISISYSAGHLHILTEGRALAKGSAGDVIPVLNLSSRNTVMGRIQTDGSVQVGPPQG